MGIVDTRQMNPLAAAFDDNAFVEQHSHPHPLQVGDHADCVMVAQNGPLNMFGPMDKIDLPQGPFATRSSMFAIHARGLSQRCGGKGGLT
jgi:hypothetical protein